MHEYIIYTDLLVHVMKRIDGHLKKKKNWNRMVQPKSWFERRVAVTIVICVPRSNSFIVICFE